MRISEEIKERLLFNPYIDYDIKIDGYFKTVFDVSYTLIDIQALISGFIKTIEDSVYDSMFYEDIPYVEERQDDEVIERIFSSLDRRLHKVEEKEVKDLKTEIENIYLQYKDPKVAKRDIQAYNSTHRNFLKKYKKI